MKSKIHKEDDHVIINITQIDDDQDAILQNLHACKEGKCSCPTNEYEKLENLEITIDTDLQEIKVDLKPKKNQAFALNEIEKCLDHTASTLATKD